MYKLQDLPYLYQDLEPYISTHTIALHINKHTKNYLNNLNNLLLKNNYQFNYSLTELIFHIAEFPNDQEDILFNLGGVLNHNLYFHSLGKKLVQPEGLFKVHFDKKYQSISNFLKILKEKALKLKGSGYVFLILKQNKELDLINLPNQETPWLNKDIPLFCIDLWEHAYYLDYQNDKAKYLDNLSSIVDFSLASEIFNNYYPKL